MMRKKDQREGLLSRSQAEELSDMFTSRLRPFCQPVRGGPRQIRTIANIRRIKIKLNFGEAVFAVVVLKCVSVELDVLWGVFEFVFCCGIESGDCFFYVF
mgnify:CR=1 FL=1